MEFEWNNKRGSAQHGRRRVTQSVSLNVANILHNNSMNLGGGSRWVGVVVTAFHQLASESDFERLVAKRDELLLRLAWEQHPWII